ncbi:MAG: hypothetical protein GY832_46550, partial [Chloroflexi bacterium]|nr:hypothetical protein [Chloroflexota bacterium]
MNIGYRPFFIVLSIIVAVLITLFVQVPPALADTCTWTGVVGTNWHAAGNWDGCGIPASDDDVIVPSSGVSNEPVISTGDVAIHNLTVSSNHTLTIQGGRVLTMSAGTLNNSGAITGGGAFHTQGTSFLHQDGVLDVILQVASGTTRGYTGAYNAPITIASGATLQVDYGDTLTANADVTVNGALDDSTSTENFVFNGTTFRNAGTVDVENFTFNRAGMQTLAGTGSWSGSTRVIIVDGSTIVLNNALTMSPNSFTLNGGGALSLTHSFTLSDTTLTNDGTITGAESLQTQGALNLYQRGNFDVALHIMNGTTQGYGDGSTTGIYDGPITIAPGANLRVVYGDRLVANADVVVNGTLDDSTSTEYFVFNGAIFRNTGTVDVEYFTFNRAGTQTLAGAGAWSGSTRVIIADGATTLPGNALTMSP